MVAAVQDCCFSCKIISQEARPGFIDALHVELKLKSWRCWGLDVSAYVQQVRDLRILGDICNFDIDVRIEHASSAEFNKMVRLLRELCKLVRGRRTRPMRASNIRITSRRRKTRLPLSSYDLPCAGLPVATQISIVPGTGPAPSLSLPSLAGRIQGDDIRQGEQAPPKGEGRS